MSMRIRLASESDAEAMVAIYRPIVESTMISFETTAPDRAEMAQRVRDTLEWHPWLVCEAAGQVAGYAYATKHRVRDAYRWSADTSVYIADEYRRRGVGRGLYDSLLAILASQGYCNAYAGIALPNAASVALHESAGFEPIGVYRGVGYKLGRWWDVGWWHRSLRDRGRAPDPPQRLTSIAQLADWNAMLRRGEAHFRGVSDDAR